MFDSEIIALLDSGANMSVVGGKAMNILNNFNITINPSGKNQVTTADGTKRDVLGVVDFPINVNNSIQIIFAKVFRF